ncbi:MAG: hypothetical protein V1724_06190 [Chloroflexota bacterium]
MLNTLHWAIGTGRTTPGAAAASTVVSSRAKAKAYARAIGGGYGVERCADGGQPDDGRLGSAKEYIVDGVHIPDSPGRYCALLGDGQVNEGYVYVHLQSLAGDGYLRQVHHVATHHESLEVAQHGNSSPWRW